MKKIQGNSKVKKTDATFKKASLRILILILVCLAVLLLVEPRLKLTRKNSNPPDSEDMTETESAPEMDTERVTVVVDPGHGGRDPGKEGVNGAKEKDINLKVALKLKKHLEDNKYNVIMTREEDVGLYSESDSNKHAADLKKRVELVNSSDAIVAVSIHQNSFPQESTKGAQVFYFTGSQEGERFAGIMQEQLKQTLQDGNKRKEKANDSYYMLKKTRCPIIIVECGFLSNYQEAELLTTDTYQEKLAEAIYLGLHTYIEQTKE